MGSLRVLCLGLALSGLCGSAEAQSSVGEGWERHITAFAAAGRSGRDEGWGVLHFGAGFEWVRPSGLGIAAEIGPRFKDYDLSAFDDLMFSVAATYHLGLTGDRRVTPFVVGGFAVAFEPVPDPGPAYSFIDVGGGLFLRLHDKGGIRLEIRDAFTVAAEEATDPGSYLRFHAGYTWVSGRK